MFEQIKAKAVSESWSRKQIKDVCYAEKLTVDQRDEIWSACGHKTSAETQVQILSEAAAKQAAEAVAQATRAAEIAARPKLPPAGRMFLKFACKDALTGKDLQPGTEVTGVKVGGAWDFTAEPISWRELKSLREAMLMSLGTDEGGPDGEMDHEDYYILADYGKRYPAVARMIGCHVPGLE